MRHIRYPHHRKSPIRHHVRNHIRKHRPVHDYDRGHGTRPNNPVRRRFKPLASAKTNVFSIRIEYPDCSVEGFDVNAQNFVGALDQGLMQRRQLKIPVAVSMKRL